MSPDSDATGTVRIPWFPDPPGDDTTQKPVCMGRGRFSYSLLSIIPYLLSNAGTFVFEWLGEQSNIQHRTIHRTTPPQSARSGCQLPQRWSRGRSAPRRMRSFGCLRKSGVTGGFYPPLQSVCKNVLLCIFLLTFMNIYGIIFSSYKYHRCTVQNEIWMCVSVLCQRYTRYTGETTWKTTSQTTKSTPKTTGCF